jgi:hypothetical protein
MINPLFAFFSGLLGGILAGVMIPKMRIKMYGFIKVHFIDIDKDIIIYGRPETFDYEDRTYIIDYNKIKRHTAYYDSRFAEMVNIESEPDFSKWKYYINSKTAYTTLHNKVLQELMLINESNFIKIILIAVIACLIISLISLFISYSTSNELETIAQMIFDLKSTVVIG